MVPYQRIYGVDEPALLLPLANDGKLSRDLPEGTPYALVGSSSLYKRESYPYGNIPQGKVTASSPGGDDVFQGLGSLSFSGSWQSFFTR